MVRPVIGRKTTQPNRSLASMLFPTIVLVWAFLACAHEANAHGGVAPAPRTRCADVSATLFNWSTNGRLMALAIPLCCGGTGATTFTRAPRRTARARSACTSGFRKIWSIGSTRYTSRDLVTYKHVCAGGRLLGRQLLHVPVCQRAGALRAKDDPPTGPFTAQTGNIGLGIDGSVFIDDDGSWYFTHAGHRGIHGYRISDPYTVGTPRLLEADLAVGPKGR